MLITGNNITIGGHASNYVTAIISPAALNLILAAIVIETATSTNPGDPSLLGCGLTWILVASQIFDSTSSSRRKLFVFRAMGVAPTTGAITITPNEASVGILWSIDQFDFVDTSGTNGSGAVSPQTAAKNSDEAGTHNTITATLGAFGNVNNATYAADGNATGNLTFTPGSGFSELNHFGLVSPGIDIFTEFKNSNDTTADLTTSANDFLGIIALEIKAATTPIYTSAPGNPFHPGMGVLNNARFKPSQQQGAIFGINYTQTLNDTLIFTDTISKSLIRTFADSFGNTESIIKDLVRTLTDTIGNTEVFSKNPQKVLSDTLPLSDSIIKNPQKVLSDTFSLSDTISRLLTRILSDTVVFVESFITLKTQFLILIDSISFSEVLAKLTIKTLSDTIVFIESKATSLVRSLSDSIGLTDTINKAITYARTFTDSIGFTDNILKSIIKTLSDTLTFSETLGIVRGYFKNLSDSIALTDTISTIKVYVRTLLDTFSLTDTIEMLFNSLRAGIPSLGNFFRSILDFKPGGGLKDKDKGDMITENTDKPSRR